MKKELRNTNAAIMVAFSICNAALALKKQHVQPIYKQFIKDKSDLSKYNAQQSAGQIPKSAACRFTADLRSFPSPIVPIETLKEIVYSKVSAFGRPLALVSVLEQSLGGLEDAITKREILIQRFSSGSIPKKQIPEYYFGTMLPDGNMNQEYPDIIEAIYSYVDDLTFFSALLSMDLVEHGNMIHEAYTKNMERMLSK